LAGGQPLQRNRAYGVYVNFMQQLTEGAPATGRGVNVFLNASEPAEGLNAFLTPPSLSAVVVAPQGVSTGGAGATAFAR